MRTSCKDQVHGVLAKLGVTVTCTDIFGTAGSAWLDGLPLPQPYAGKVTSLRHLADELSTEITMLTEVIADLLAGDRGYRVRRGEREEPDQIRAARLREPPQLRQLILGEDVPGRHRHPSPQEETPRWGTPNRIRRSRAVKVH